MAQPNQPILMNQAQLQALVAALAPGGQNDGGRRKLTIFSSALPTDWRTWRRNFETISVINNWDDERSRREAAAAMEGTAALSVQDIDHEAAADIATLLDLYQSRFIPEAAGKLARAEFNAAGQKPTETIIQWHTRLRELFCRAYPNREIDDDEAAIDQFVNNLLDTSIQSFVLDQAPDTYAEALNVAQGKLANQLIMKKNGESKTLHQMGEPSSQSSLNQMGRPFVPGAGRSSVKCWYCEKEGHMQNACEDFKKGLAYFSNYFKEKEKNSGQGKRGRGGKGKKAPKNPTTNAIPEANLLDTEPGN